MKHSILAFAAAGLLSACTDAGASLAFCEADEGVEVVMNRGASVCQKEGVEPRLVELWRAGGLTEGESLAYPAGLAASASGYAAIPDFALGTVVLISPDGRWLGEAARRGGGPGEVETPVAVSWSGERLGVFDLTAPKVQFLTLDGAVDELRVDPVFTAPIVSSGEVAWAGVDATGGVLALVQRRDPAAPAGGGERVEQIVRLPPGASGHVVLIEGRVRTLGEGAYSGIPAPGATRPMAAVGGSGLLATAGDEAVYRISILDSEGTAIRQVCRDAAAFPLTDRERGRVAAEGSETLAEALAAAQPPEEVAPFGRLLLAEDGGLWVQRDRPQPGDPHAFLGSPGALYDLFDEEGRYLGELRAPERARLQAVVGDTAWALEFGEFDEPSVVAYRLELN